MTSTDAARLSPLRSLFEASAQAGALTAGEQLAVAGILATVQPQVALIIGEPADATASLIAGVVSTVERIPAEREATLADGDPIDLVYVSASAPVEHLAATLELLLGAARTAESVWLFEGTSEPARRAALDGLEFGAWEAVHDVDLDLVPGHLCVKAAERYELAGGIGLVVTSSSSARQLPVVHAAASRYPAAHVLRRGRDVLQVGDAVADLPALPEGLRETHLQTLQGAVDPDGLRAASTLRTLHAEHEQLLNTYLAMVNSPSWRLTAPIRRLKGAPRGRR